MKVTFLLHFNSVMDVTGKECSAFTWVLNKKHKGTYPTFESECQEYDLLN